MKLTLSCRKLTNTISGIPTSKSYANRALIYSFLSSRKLILKNLPSSQDVLLLSSAIKSVLNGDTELYLGEGGTTIRFLIAALALKGEKFFIRVHKRFESRPMDEYFKALTSLGVSVNRDLNEYYCTIKGPISEGTTNTTKELIIDCSQTTQFLSAFLLIGDFCSFKLKPVNLRASKPYVEMTKKVIADLKLNNEYTIPVDFSSASMLISYAAINKKIVFPQILKIDPLQADSAIFSVLDLIGASYSFSSDGLTIEPNYDLRGFNFNVLESPDLTMSLIYLAIFLKGRSTISGIKNLRFKETDRINGIKEILESLNVNYSLTDDSIEIVGQSFKTTSRLDPYPDHRIVMMSAMILKQMGGGVVTNTDCVDKSFPNFFKVLEGVN